MRGGAQRGDEGGRGRGRGRHLGRGRGREGLEEVIETEQRRRGPNSTREIRATLIDHVINGPWTDTDGSWTKSSTKSQQKYCCVSNSDISSRKPD